MKKVKVITLGMCCLTVLSCQTKQGTGALIGTGGGAVLGAPNKASNHLSLHTTYRCCALHYTGTFSPFMEQKGRTKPLVGWFVERNSTPIGYTYIEFDGLERDS